MILSTIRVVLGLLFVLFLPGYLLSLILFKRLQTVERICLAVGLSVVIVVFLGFFLTAIGYLTNLKGITVISVWLSLLIICGIFTFMVLGEYWKSYELY